MTTDNARRCRKAGTIDLWVSATSGGDDEVMYIYWACAGLNYVCLFHDDDMMPAATVAMALA